MKKPNRSRIILSLLALVTLGVGAALWFRPRLRISQSRLPEATAAQAPVAPTEGAAAPSLAASAVPSDPAEVVAPRKKFEDMGFEERNAVRQEIAQRDLRAIFQAMLDADRVEHDSMKQLSLQRVFGGALRQKHPTPEFLEQLRVFVTTPGNSSFERQLVIGALELASTKETVDLLLRIAASASEKKIREAVGSLAGVGDLGQGGKELSPALEQAWRESKETNVLVSTSSSLAKIGSPSGIQLLLEAAQSANGRDDVRKSVAQQALSQVFLPSAVPPLAAALTGQAPANEAARLVAPLLVQIGDRSAGAALLTWLQGRDEDATPLIRELIVQRTTTSEMLAAWGGALRPTVRFRNERNREAIRDGLTAYRAGHTLQ